MRTRWFTVILIVVALIVGFGNGYLWGSPQDAELKEQVDSIDSTQSVPDTVLKEAELPDSYLPVFWVDVNTYALGVHCYIRVPEHLTLKEKMQFFIGELSRVRFSSLPMDLVSIEQREEKRIALINLREPEGQQDGRGFGPWYGMFGGSTGGSITSSILVLTLLQSDYDGEWVDGVQFLYNGKPAEFPHAEKIGGPHFRNP